MTDEITLDGFNSIEEMPVKKRSRKEEDDVYVPDEIKVKTMRRKTQNIYRRAFSELQLIENLEPLKPEMSYHVISGGDVDALSFLKHILKQQALDYCLFSTWCMAMDDVQQIQEWMKTGRIKRMDAYCGEIFPGSYRKEYEALKPIIEEGGGRVAIFRNHSKVFAGTGPLYSFGIASSANINTNPRTENTIITTSRDCFIFYKDFFDGVKSFTKDDKNWKKWGI